MTALILASGVGSRMGDITAQRPKCMTPLPDGETILSRQLRQLCAAGTDKIVITTGAFADVLRDYVSSLGVAAEVIFVHNPDFETTNYIYSMFLAEKELDGDILLLHGDLVFEDTVLQMIAGSSTSAMAVSTTRPLPEKDFKAVISGDTVRAVGIDFTKNAAAAMPLYRLTDADRRTWLTQIGSYCRSGDSQKLRCYAENALNEVSDKCSIRPVDFTGLLCAEIDTPDDLAAVSAELACLKSRRVYMCFSADVIHSGHINMIRRAAALGRLTIGIMTDRAVTAYKHLPLVAYADRAELFRNINGVAEVVPQDTLSYRDNLTRLKPDIVVHGDDWRKGFQQPVREEVVSVLAGYGGKLVEFPYSDDPAVSAAERSMRCAHALPDYRRGVLRKLLDTKRNLTAIEAHSGLTGLIAENSRVYENGTVRQFDAMWISSLCDSTSRGKPDIELVDMTARMRTVNEIMEVTTKPVIFDGDTGGLTEHFVYTVRTLERTGVSMVIIEDKSGLKKNSLFGTEVEQVQADTEEFCRKISAGKKALKTDELMICARIESLILGMGMDDALRRALAYTAAGADAIMIHSRSSSPDEVLTFARLFREQDGFTPLVCVPTSYSSVTEEELYSAGINIVIYANQLTRSAFPAMQQTAESILRTHSAAECEEMCMPFREIIRLIPEEY
ncbi:MAG: phosphoenolpyruvate mutase [Ruminococcus sp.]|nr:phosphoenolpyruvate mutase [Ruminococcus sp.]